MKCKRWTGLKMTRMEMTASLTDKNHHACENRKWYQLQLSSTQPVSDFEMHSTFEEPLSPDKELSTLWFCRYWIFSVVYSSSRGRLAELTINREIWIVIIPKNSISYLSDPSDLLIAKKPEYQFQFNSKCIASMWNHSHQTFHTLQPNSKPIGSGQIMKASYTSVTKLEIWSCCIVQIQSRNNQKTRWYPWGIQQLVSTHQLPHKSGGYSRPSQIQSAKICPNFHFRGRGG